MAWKRTLIEDDGIDILVDVDTSTDAPAKNEVLKWNGSKWVPATYDTNFTFSIASFSDGESTTQLIGTGSWQTASSISFTATYNNGPPTSSTILMSINGASYNQIGTMDSPNYLSGTNTGSINYPSAKDQYLRFRLDASDSEDSDSEYETAIYFRNYLFWGVETKSSGFTEADIEGLANNQLTNDNTQSKSINAGEGEYLVWACPASYTDLPTGDDYEDDSGGTGFVFKGLTCAFVAKETLSVTNSAGFEETYEVYASSLPNLGNSTLTTYTSRTTLNYLYYGVTENTSSFSEADVEGLANSTITNDNTQTWSSVTAGVGEYLLFAFPKRLGIPTFYVGGFEGGFESPETVSITNINGWTEDYYVWRSTNSGLGATTVQTQ